MRHLRGQHARQLFRIPDSELTIGAIEILRKASSALRPPALEPRERESKPGKPESKPK